AGTRLGLRLRQDRCTGPPGSELETALQTRQLLLMPFHDGVVMQRGVFVYLVSTLATAPLAAQRPTAPAPTPSRPPVTAPQSGTPGFRIAFISSRTILDSTPGYAAAESTFYREYQGMRDEIQKLQQQLDSAV